jgi:signal transduction histidine kinase
VTGYSPDDQLAGRAPAIAAGNELTVRGLLHDLGHQMMTLSLLADSVRGDSALSAASRQRMELVMQEMLRILDIIADSMPADAGQQAPGAVDVRILANEVANLAALTYDATVTVEPGGPAVIRIGASLMWRVLANLVDNAVRAAGPRGRVDIRIEQGLETVLEITDNGPGFGGGPAGEAGIGLSVVRQLLDSADGRLHVSDAPDGGARVRVTFSPDR